MPLLQQVFCNLPANQIMISTIISLKTSHSQLSVLFLFYFFCRYYNKYFVISLQIKSSLVLIINYSKDLALKWKKRPHRQHIRLSVFLFNWVGCLQKLVVYTEGVRFLEFDVRARPRSVTCVHKTLTPRMKHTRVPRTVRRDIWRLAMETLSIPSLHIIWSRIRNQIESRVENRKKTNGPNRKSNLLKK